MTNEDENFLRRALELAAIGMDAGVGGPFGAIVVKDGEVIAEGFNSVTSTNDPTAHAEIMAIREACRKLGTFQLDDCVIYTSCEPCPMCLGAIYWARVDRVVYACNRHDAAGIGFDDQYFYDELNKDISERTIKFEQLLQEEALPLFKKWAEKPNKVNY